ncbi:MAG: CinA family protein, partial [Bauldia sp.]|nr:CinA family protein [Bauldia sp.]
SEDKPVGTVHFALARRGSHAHHIVRNFGDIGRSEVRLATVRTALELIAAAVAATSAASG